MELELPRLQQQLHVRRGTEKRQRWNIAAAVEGPKLKDADGKDKDGCRALVFADADLFATRWFQNVDWAARAC